MNRATSAADSAAGPGPAPGAPGASRSGNLQVLRLLLRRARSQGARQSSLVRAPGYKWFLLGVLFLVAAINYADRTAPTALLPLLRSDLGLSDAGLAAIGSFFLWSYALVLPLVGYLGDRFSRRAIVILGLAAWSVVTVFTGLVTTGSQFLGMRVLLGITQALYVPTALALLAEHHSTGTRAKAMAGHFSGLHAGMLAGGTFAGYAGDYYGWRSCFLILGGAGLLLAGLCWFTVYQNVPPAAGQAASSPPPRQSLGDALAGVLRIPSFLVLCLDSFLTSMSTWVFMNWLPLYYRETFGLSLTAAGFSGTFTLVAGTMAGVLAGGYISDRVARRAAKYRMLMQAAGHLAGAPLLLVFASPAGLPVVVAAGVLFFVFRGSSQANGHPMVCELVGAERWGTGLGTVIMVASVSGGVGVQLSGYLKSSFGLASIFAGASLMVLLNGVILIGGYLLFLERDLKRRAALAGAAQ